MGEDQQFLQNLYDAFNRREIETLISVMTPDVKWANGRQPKRLPPLLRKEGSFLVDAYLRANKGMNCFGGAARPDFE
jgi:hypothetical protein